MIENKNNTQWSIKVGRKTLKPGEAALLVAEIGGNHGGDSGLARTLVAAAAAAGADAVKFQAYRCPYFLSPLSPYYDELAAEELSFDSLAALVEYARGLGLMAGLTVFDQAGLELAGKCEADFIKISSGDLTNHPLLTSAARSGHPVFVSTGAADEEEVAEALSLMAPARDRLVLMQCASLYPAPPEAANLAVLAKWLGQGLAAGYSDHCLGLEAAEMALALGAVVLEKHFTTDRNLPGGDNQISARTEEMARLARLARLAPILRGSPVKAPQREEEAMRAVIRRAPVAAVDLAAGHKLQPGDLMPLRPPAAGNFYQLRSLADCLGRTLIRALTRGQALSPGDLEEDRG